MFNSNIEKCQNNGRCTEQGLNYICSCPTGFTGMSCENRDPCQPNPVIILLSMN